MRLVFVLLMAIFSFSTFSIDLSEEIMKIWGANNITVNPSGKIIFYDLGDNYFKIFSGDLTTMNKLKISIGPGPSQIKKTFDYSIVASKNELFVLESFSNKVIKVFSISGQYIKSIKTKIYSDKILLKDNILYIFSSLMNRKEYQEVEIFDLNRNKSNIIKLKYNGILLHSLAECINKHNLYTIPEETENMLFKINEKGVIEAKWKLPFSIKVVKEQNSHGFSITTPKYYGEMLIFKENLYSTYGSRDAKKDKVVKTVVFSYDLKKKALIWRKEFINKNYILLKKEDNNLILFDNDDYDLLKFNIDNKSISIIK